MADRWLVLCENLVVPAWSALGSGLAGFPIAMTTYNGELIVAGTFGSAGGVAVNHIAR